MYIIRVEIHTTQIFTLLVHACSGNMWGVCVGCLIHVVMVMRDVFAGRNMKL